MGTVANSEDIDEKHHNAAFHQYLHCLLSETNLIFREKITIFF